MGKTLKTFGIVVVVLLVAGGLLFSYLLSNLDSLVKQAIETVGSQVVGTQVSVDQVVISLDEGRGEISGLRIANPRGFQAGDALASERIVLDLDIANTSAALVTIESIIVSGARINAVQAGGENNLQTLLDNIRRSDDGSTKQSDASSTKLIIDEFRFEDAQVSVALAGLPGGGRSAAVPNVVLRDIGRKDGGISPGQAARQILEPLMQRSMEAGIGISRQQLENRAKEEVDKAMEQGRKKLGDLLRR
jgi:hypothetical protein